MQRLIHVWIGDNNSKNLIYIIKYKTCNLYFAGVLLNLKKIFIHNHLIDLKQLTLKFSNIIICKIMTKHYIIINVFEIGKKNN